MEKTEHQVAVIKDEDLDAGEELITTGVLASEEEPQVGAMVDFTYRDENGNLVKGHGRLVEVL